jgi:Na+-translocating ferredoxin:NAD+ oxidoreductase RnfG subunit
MSADRKRLGAGLAGGVAILAAICLVSGLGVGLLYVKMKPAIDANQQAVFDSALAEVIGTEGTRSVVGDYPAETPQEDIVYVMKTPSGVLYAAMGSVLGYQSQVKVLVSVKADAPDKPVGEDPVIHTMAVVSSEETPGLGENVKAVSQDVSFWAALTGARSAPKRPWFQAQFSGRRLSDLVVVKQKTNDKIEAITGATITSTAATNAARQAIEKIIKRTAEVYGK